MGAEQGKHVFVSYVREDSVAVDTLCSALEAAGIPYWRDRQDLGPGDAWRAKIRSAIKDGSMVFLACFSDNSRSKAKSYMNEELSLAVEEFRQMAPGRVWLIPLRLDAGELPDWDLGAGRTLGDLNYVDLFGPNHLANTVGLVASLARLLGEKHIDSATALAAVERASDANRSDLVKRLTKEMLLDPTRRIELDDLVSQETQRVLALISDADRLSAPLPGSNEDQIIQLAVEAQDLWHLLEPFCASLQVAARWGSPEQLTPWVSGVKAFVTAATKPASGSSARIQARHLPGVVTIMTAAIACVAAGSLANLGTIAVEPMVRGEYSRKMEPLLDATDPYTPFGQGGEWVVNALALTASAGISLEAALGEFTREKRGKYFTPFAEWMFTILRPLFSEQLPDDDSYAAMFDRAEVLLGVLAQDLVNVRQAAEDSGTNSWARSHWYGRSTWRASRNYVNPVNDLADELRTQGSRWPAVQAGLFGADIDRARAALDAYQVHFDEIARTRW